MDSIPHDLSYPADIETAPEKAVADYLISKKLESELIKKVPEWDVARDSPDANLVAAKRDLVEINVAQQREKAACDRRAKVVNENWDLMRKKQNELHNSFQENKKVLKKNYKERQRSKKQITGEVSEEQRIKKEIEELEKELEWCNEAEASLSAKVEEFKVYEEFLQKVIDSYPEYRGIDDVLNRYESLVETRQKLKKLHEANVNVVEKIRKDVEVLTEENIREMQELAWQFSDLRIKKYHIQTEIEHWSQAIERVRDMETQKYIEITKAIEGIWLLYLNMCAARNREPEFERSQFKEQLQYVVDNMFMLNCVISEAKRIMNRSNRGNKPMIPSERELDKWSKDYEQFQSINSNKAKPSNN
ncbi:coiled-coil domain-containing protein 42 homolog isoform X1 [Ischnura elegans]|uniref:coiled-coil domain-containing protein 42 homolog isoform X1 n=1 Tax=Ischnura elegans TaxID=197161 RepID=UPI001ED8B60B|nr:coiled-coil domain-containing protein 42 homolog isoform X1 [Ischnura elegans]